MLILPSQFASRVTARHLRFLVLTSLLGAASLLAGGCADKKDTEKPPEFALVALNDKAAFTAIHGTSSTDVWAVGADDGSGPLVLHYGKSGWTRHDLAIQGDLWWVHAVDESNVFFAGSDSHIVHYDGASFERMSTPGLGKHIVFGLWARAADDVYAVGAVGGRNGFVWHYDGQEFSEIVVPEELMDENRDIPPFFKVSGTPEGDVWIVGGQGSVLRGSAADGFAVVESPTDERLFTVHVDQSEVVIVGGSDSGVVLRADATQSSPELRDVTPEGAELMQGACVQASGDDWISGRDGELYLSTGESFKRYEPAVNLGVQSLHAVWVDPTGYVWAAGGNVLSSALDGGAVVSSKPRIGLWEASPTDPTQGTECPAEAVDLAPDGSIARRWNEQLLSAIRRDLPRPTVHARNLYHVSVAMWDVWAAYDATARGVVVDEDIDVAEVETARAEALSYAAYRVLSHRYRPAIGGVVSQSCFDQFMDLLGYDIEDDSAEGDSPRALGNRVGQAIIEAFSDDGANEENDYADPDGYAPDQPLLIVEAAGTEVDDPTQWQQILLAEAVTQNGIDEGSGVRAYVGAHWGHVTPFALARTDPVEPYYAGQNPPTEMNADLIDAALEVLRKSSELDVEDGTMMDISPAGYGNNSLGSDDGTGYGENPITGEPYEEHVVSRGDFTRVLAEFWADGPTSETPPGHWNTLFNYVSDHPDATKMLFGEGEELSDLAWDVHVYLALNGAVHDAAIAAWEVKRRYTTARPITLIRYLAGLGQSSDPDGPSYHADGLPLAAGLVEVITEESSAPGERHAHLARYEGDIAVRSWRGEPGDRETELGGVGWIRGVDWVPYQRRTFVTPAFPGYVSGHSTFSRAAAETLTQITGSAFFPGGLGMAELSPGYLFFEQGPSAPLKLMWATYYDAADQAGQSRLWGGIHIRNDDYDGRQIGADVGTKAVALARTYFEGTVN